MSTKNKLKAWEKIALRGISIAFNSDGEVRSDLSDENRQEAIEILKQSIELGPDLCWPYIKLADLVQDNDKYKYSLYVESLQKEDNIYAIKFLFKKIIADNPQILDNYII